MGCGCEADAIIVSGDLGHTLILMIVYMNIYSRKNVAKQWILSEVERLAAHGPLKVCDLACGYGSCWPQFLMDHQHISYVGIDTDVSEIKKAKNAFAHCVNAQVKVGDAQTLKENEGIFDVVTAFSALEHVVNLDAFVKTTMLLLKPGGRAFLNYDAGHFRSLDVKERLMVPVSQLLAKVGFEGPYMKEVDDEELKRIVQKNGGKIESLLKFNGVGMKSLAGSDASEEAIRAWHEFELRMNSLVAPNLLDPIFWSTVLVVEKI